ncbi:hypothetical protein CLOHIR_00657 [Peptacetobacter hiranonis DSM 13275]|uniref:Uncharacterized protein n=1 Tax=Peptacetobacter hiranonis (strain DSM 13275 / JCM 10541 / KCTC 15199 / TO-931) TaxID=500633 RepID=B6FXQ6_PEPHT|nr:hypothetical protein CLOHIR_00657 [Peptacetobacter hiranonis DSM 13275]
MYLNKNFPDDDIARRSSLLITFDVFKLEKGVTVLKVSFGLLITFDVFKF